MNIIRTRAQMAQTNCLYLLCVLSQLFVAPVYANEAIYYSLGASFVTYVVVSLATPATDAAVLANWDRRLAGESTEEELVTA